MAGRDTSLLVCFAVRSEMEPFRRAVAGWARVQVLRTGIGRERARARVGPVLAQRRPALVLSSGFAGGLRSGLRAGEVVYEADADFPFEGLLAGAGARRVRFYESRKVLATKVEKAACREATGADAVEMESTTIGGLCAAAWIPWATVRVISDEAGEDLPLGLRRRMRDDGRVDVAGLVWDVARSRALRRELMIFRGRLVQAADALATVLRSVTGAWLGLRREEEAWTTPSAADSGSRRRGRRQ